MTDKILSGKTALVTGATSGIGKATALALADAGAQVVLGARRATEGGEVVSAIRERGGTALFVPTDVTVEGQAEALVAAAVENFGGLHVAFNNAGIEGEMRPIVEDSEENLRRILEVNLFGVWRSLKAQVAAIAESGGGSIVNNTSVAGRKGFPSFSAYVASKFAVEGLTRSIAIETAASRVRVNAVAPGPIETPLLDRATGGDHQVFTQFVPMGRAGTSEEVARTVVFLGSDASSYITGQSFAIDGGMSA